MHFCFFWFACTHTGVELFLNLDHFVFVFFFMVLVLRHRVSSHASVVYTRDQLVALRAACFLG